jgi:hypothetical protein
MTLYFAILAALPLGYFVPRRGVALVTFLIAHSFVFSWQSIGVLLTWLSGGKGIGGGSGFGPAPSGELPLTFSNGELVAYGIVNLIIIAAGVGLVIIGAKLRARRSKRHTVNV